MFSNFLLFAEVFIFTLAVLNVIKNLYNTVKVMRTHEGKIEKDESTALIFAISISYIVATLCVGF